MDPLTLMIVRGIVAAFLILILLAVLMDMIQHPPRAARPPQPDCPEIGSRWIFVATERGPVAITLLRIDGFSGPHGWDWELIFQDVASRPLELSWGDWRYLRRSGAIRPEIL